MFQRIAAATIIRGNGECQAYIDGVVSKELVRIQARSSVIEDSRNRLLTEHLAVLNLTARKSPVRRMLARLADAYALVMGTLIVWGLQLGLLEEVQNDG